MKLPIECVECHKIALEVGGNGSCARCYQAAWRKVHPEQVKAAKQKYKAANDERIKAQDAVRRSEHPERQRAADARWYAKHREKSNAISRAYYQAHRSRIAERYARWGATHREQVKALAQRREARKRALPATLTAEQWTAILAAFKDRCAYCGRSGLKLEQDHVHPLSKGGAYEMGNIVPACRPCNARKGNRVPLKPVQTLLL